MSVKASVVAVWKTYVPDGEKKEKDEFIGSAIFITPKLLLTAKHVVHDKKTGAWFSKLHLRLVAGREKVEINTVRIRCHPTLDIAVIALNEPDEEQDLSVAYLTETDFRNQKVDFFGINDTNRSQDASYDHSIGIMDQAHHGYRFDHRVKKGFSGGAVALHEQNEVMGIISQRDTENQETLFIPLYTCRDWLLAAATEFGDSHLQSYATPKPMAASKQQVPITNFFSESVLFVGRPQQAYQHVLNNLLGEGQLPGSPVKACFCVYRNIEDAPSEFAVALGRRLENRIKQGISYELLNDKNAYQVEQIDISPWDFDREEDFFSGCLDTISAKLGLETPANGGNDQKEFEKIVARVKARKVPLILQSKSGGQSVAARCFGFLNAKIINKINRCHRWVENFNRRWQQAIASDAAQLQSCMVILFCLPVDERLMLSSRACFHLQSITPVDVSKWLDDLENLLNGRNLYAKEYVSTARTDFEVDFANRQGGTDVDYQISYVKFRNDTKTVINTHRKESS